MKTYVGIQYLYKKDKPNKKEEGNSQPNSLTLNIFDFWAQLYFLKFLIEVGVGIGSDKFLVFIILAGILVEILVADGGTNILL